MTIDLPVILYDDYLNFLLSYFQLNILAPFDDSTWVEPVATTSLFTLREISADSETGARMSSVTVSVNYATMLLAVFAGLLHRATNSLSSPATSSSA